MKKQNISSIKKSRGVQCLSVSHQNLLLGGKADGDKAEKDIVIEDQIMF